VGVPLLGSVFLIVYALGVAYLLGKSDTAKLEGRLHTMRNVMYLFCIVEFLGGFAMLLSPVLTTGIALAVVPVLAVWGLKRNDAYFLATGAAAQAWAVWRLVGVAGPNGIFDTLNLGDCNSLFANKALCDAGWRAFLAFLALGVLFAALLLVPGLLFVLRESRVGTDHESRGGSNSAVAGGDTVSRRGGETDALLP
jgi:hypothetical protein